MDENPTSAFRSKLQGIFKELGPFYSASPLGLLLVVLETGLGPGTSPPRIRKAAAISGVVPAILNSEMKLEAAQEKIPRGERCLRTSSVPTRNIQKCQQLDLTFRSNVGPSLSEQTAASGGPAEAGGPDPTRIPALIWPLEQCNISTEGLTPASRSFSDSQNPPGWTGGKANRAEKPVGLGKNDLSLGAVRLEVVPLNSSQQHSTAPWVRESIGTPLSISSRTMPKSCT